MGRAVDANGFVATQSYTLVVIGDTTPPVITPTVTGTLGNNGWYVSDVTVSWSVVDNESTVTRTSGCQTTVIATDTTGTTLTCTATSAGGTASQSVTIQRDATPPTLNPSISPNPVLLNGTASASPNASDATSLVASSSCGTVATSPAGDHTVTCTATDNAGNTNSVTVHYTVQYKILGLFSPAQKSKRKPGQTVPIKVALADANGVRISDSEAQSLLSPTCRVTFSATGAQTTSGCMKYDTATDQFVFNWMLGSATGSVTISVTVSHPSYPPGTSTTTVLSESITVTK